MKPVALAALGFVALSPPALAQDVDCSDPQTQSEMNICSYQMWQAADGDLNYAYKMARDVARTMDASLPDEWKGAEVALRDAQRAWITFRDKNCELAGFAAQGGSMEPLLVNTCMEDMTRKRTEELRSIYEMN